MIIDKDQLRLIGEVQTINGERTERKQQEE